MCNVCEETEQKFRQNVNRSGTDSQKEGDIMGRETLWRLWKEQQAKCKA